MPSTVRRDGERAEFLGQTERYDAAILDLGLPRMDGLTVLRRWREAGVTLPVLVLTARGSWHEKVQGIDGGADDYVAKPFRMEEVLARLRALIRRASGQLNAELRCGALALDSRSARVTVGGVPVKLTSHEFRVLSYLMHHRERIVSQPELTEHIYAQNVDRDSNTVEVFIARLRRKLGPSLHRNPSRARLSDERGRSTVRSLRGRLMLGAALWTIGLLAVWVVLLNVWRAARATIVVVHEHGPVMAALAVTSMVTGLIVVRSAIVPLEAMRRRLADVRKGLVRQLEGRYPSEVQPLVDDLNALLAHNDQMVRRAIGKAGTSRTA